MTDTLKADLEAACKDLWWSSESDYPVEVVWQPVEAFSDMDATDNTADITSNNNNLIRQWIAQRENSDDIKTADSTAVFARWPGLSSRESLTPKSWHTPEDKAQLEKFKQLKHLLEKNLKPLHIYRCGEIEIGLYILGVTSQNVLAGVKTILVET